MSTDISHPLDTFTTDLFNTLFSVKTNDAPTDEAHRNVAGLYRQAVDENRTAPIVALFRRSRLSTTAGAGRRSSWACPART